jgi:4-amino-4-deoxy-L-arabinose transferase-like glycosyltransferase
MAMASRTVQFAPQTSASAPATGLTFKRLATLFVPASIALLLAFSLEMYLSVRTESQTFDEPAHLYAGYAYWLRSDFGVNPEHPPLVKLLASLPALLADRPQFPEPIDVYFRAASAFGGVKLLAPPGSQAVLGHARAAVSILALVLAALVVAAGREMFGRGTALFALALFVFDPLIVAHSALVTTDMGAACFLFAGSYAFYRYLKQPSLLRLGVCGFATGLALATKHSALFLFPILVLLSVVEIAFVWPGRNADCGPYCGPRQLRTLTRRAFWLLSSLLAIAAMSITILWASYGFRYQARPNGKAIIPSTEQYVRQLRHPIEASVIEFAERHRLLPESYLFGLTDIVFISREGRRMNLFGTIYPEGRWFYFPAALLIKSTIGFLALVALVPFVRTIRQAEKRREVFFLLIPPLAYLGWAMTSKLNIGLRHILPIYPFLILLAAASAMSLARQSRRWAWAVSLFLLFHMASSLHAAPNYLPYSNELFGGPNNTWKVLADSNVGWGGGLKALRAHIQERQITERQITDCWFAYSAFLDPASFEIPCKRLPTFFSSLADTGEQRPVPTTLQGTIFVSSEEVAGVGWGPPELNPYDTFIGMKPSRVIAGEILEYHGPVTVPRVAAFSEAVVAKGDLDARKGAIARALEHAQAAVALSPQSLQANEILAFAYAANNQRDRAIAAYRTALHLFNTVRPEFRNGEPPPENPFGDRQP